MRGITLLISGLFVVGAASCGSNADVGNGGTKAATTVNSPSSSAPGTTAAASTAAAAVGDAALPGISGPVNAKPTIKIPSTPAPKELVVKVLVEGTGAAVASGKDLTAHYVGQVYETGKQFDASWDRGQPATFPIGVGRLIKAWDQGLVGKKLGSRVLIVVPPALGYGATGNPSAGIKGTDTLVFVVDLVSTN